MDLYKEILIHALSNGEITIKFPNEVTDIEKIIEGACYSTLCKIKAILDDDNLDDTECFERIEEIVCAFEEIGSNGGFRHDFG